MSAERLAALFGLLGSVALAALAWSAWRGRPARCKPPSPPQRVLLIGDSMAEGLAVPLGGLVKASGAEFSAAYRRGTPVRWWATLLNLQAGLDAARPDTVVIALGTNDAAGHPEDSGQAIDDLLTILSRYGQRKRLVWVEPVSGGRFDAGVRMFLLQLASSAVASSVGLVRVSADSRLIELGSDNVHPTPSGYSLWASKVWSEATGGGCGQA